MTTRAASLPFPALLAAGVLAGIVLGAAAANAQQELLPSSPLPPAGERVAVFVSDLHMGVGRDPADPSRWHRLEDFRWHAELVAFLDHVQRENRGKTDLVILGDFLELWQSLNEEERGQAHAGAEGSAGRRPDGSRDCEHPDRDLGCNEDEALARAERVLSQHVQVLDALGAFAVQGENRVTIVPGNHDAALLFERVAAKLVEAFPPQARARVRVASEGYWRSRSGRIYSEHGQQIGADPNFFEGWPRAPFLTGPDGKRHLRQPWGERFVQELFNRHEREFAVLDNYAEEIKGASYAMRGRGFGGSVLSVLMAARFLIFGTSWDQTGQLLDEAGVPVWKTDAIPLATEEERIRFLVESLPEEDPLRAELMAKTPAELASMAREQLGQAAAAALVTLTPEEIQSACNRRWAAKESDETVTPCPSTGELGAIGERMHDFLVPEAKQARLREHLEDLRKKLPDDGRATRDFQLYVYGHTHKSEANERPFRADAPWKPVVFNDGAWQRTVKPEDFEEIRACKGLDKDEALAAIQPEDLAPCYPFVRAVERGDRVETALVWWVQPPGEPGAAKAECPFRCSPAVACVDERRVKGQCALPPGAENR